MLDYAFRYKTYSKELCENRFEADSSCKGTCQVSKILQGEPKQNSKPSLPSFQIAKDWLLANEPVDSDNFIAEITEWHSYWALCYTGPNLYLLEKPPQSLVLFS